MKLGRDHTQWAIPELPRRFKKVPVSMCVTFPARKAGAWAVRALGMNVKNGRP